MNIFIKTKAAICPMQAMLPFFPCFVRPDIFNFSSFKNPDRIFQEMEKKIDFLFPTV